MIIRDLFFESGSTEATKIKEIVLKTIMFPRLSYQPDPSQKGGGG
jgi:hypothetical protein